MQTNIIEKYFFFGFLLITILFSFFIFKPFWIVFVLGISFAIVLYPIYKWLNKKNIPSWLASLITVTLFTIVLCGPLLGVGALVFNQSQDVYLNVVNNGSAKPFMDQVENKINDILPDMVTFDMNEKVSNFISYISSNIANIFTNTISAFFSFVLMLLLIFYFLKDSEQCKNAIKLFSPLGEENDEKIINKIILAVNGVIKGSLLIALVQGILLGFGFWIFGIPNGALWGVVASVTSLIPTFGTALVSTPAIIFLFATGQTLPAILLLLWAILVVGMIDNFLSPYLIGRKINISSIIILFSILGGIAMLGPVGILVGPLAMSLLQALISIYKTEFK
jgi:predicted PurR-regulated permease PerM